MKKQRNKLHRRLLALALALMLCVGMLPMAAFAEGGTDETGSETVVTGETTSPADSEQVTDPAPEQEPEQNPEPATDPAEQEPESNEPAEPAPGAPAGEPDPAPADPETSNEVEEPAEPAYATLADLEAAFEQVGAVLETGDVQGGIAALDAYIAIYNRLSPEDQADNAEALAAAMAYLGTLRGSLAGEEDPEVELLAAKWHTVTLVPASTNSYSSKITSAKVRVGQKVNGYEVTSVSGTTIKVKAWGDLYGDFFLPRAADLWNGAVKSDYVIWAGTGSNQKTEGESAMLPQSNASAYYYFNTAGSVTGGGGSSSGISFVLEHVYYTNGKYDGKDSETVKFASPTFNQMFSINNFKKYQKEEYGGNTYEYTSISPESKTIKKGSTGNQGTFTMRYDRTVVTSKYNYSLTWNYNGGVVGSDSSRTKTVSDVTDSTHTFYEDASGYGSPRPTRGGYDFTGWSYSGNGSFNEQNGQINMTGTAGATVSGTLTAQWRQTDNDNGAGISITKTRVSIDGEAGKTTAERGAEIEWNITVTNHSNVTKTVTLTEKLTGASLSKKQVILEAGQSETVTATYTVKRTDEGKTIFNTVVGETDKSGEDKTAQDEGTEVPGDTPKDPGTKTGSFTVSKSFAGLGSDVTRPQVTLTYEAWRTKDGAMVGTKEPGEVSLTLNSDGTYSGTITPTVWDIGTNSPSKNYLPEDERARYKNVIVIREELSTAEVAGYTFEGFGPFYRADASKEGDDGCKFVLDGATIQKTLAVTNTYQKHVHTWVEKTDDKGHTVWANGKAPDCINNGTAIYECSCGETKEEVKSNSALGHDFTQAQWVDNCTSHEVPTCTGHTKTCTRCNGKLTGGTDSKDHNFGDWITDTAATMETEGTKHRVCGDCQHIERGTIPTLDKVTITVKYQDEKGETIQQDATVTVPKGSTYDVTEETKKIPAGFEANGDPTGDAVSGTANSDKTIIVPVKKLTYTVTYNWEGLPQGTTNPAAPEAKSYTEGTEVTVDTNNKQGDTVTIDGKTYTFSGWNVFDPSVEVKDGKFNMPASNVTIHGEWTTPTTEPENPIGPELPPVLPTTRNLTVNKVWVGDEDAGVRPDSIQVQLYQSGAAYGSPVTLSAANGWSHTWIGLSTVGTLTVEELNVPDGYTVTMESSGSTVTITNTYDQEIDDPDVPMGTPKPTPTPTPAPTEKPTPGPSATPDPGDEPIEDPDVPKGTPKPTPTPDPEEPIDDPDVPMGTPKPVKPSTPDDGEEIPDEKVPLANTPKTGDDRSIWLTLTLASAAGLVLLGISRKRKGENVR